MKLIIANHKNGIKIEDIEIYQEYLNQLTLKNKLIICPSDKQIKYFKKGNFDLGSQDIEKDISLTDLINIPITYSIIGHSDFRKKENQTNEQINNKIKILLENNICPILCIGEELEEKEIIKEVIKEELEEGLNNIKTNNIVIAYEPNWSINSGLIPGKKELKQIISYIKEISTDILGCTPLVIYGGSVSANTIKELETINEIDGYLIGKASLDINELKNIIEVIQ